MIRELLFGTAGVPVSSDSGDTISGLKQVRALGLGAMELEFVRGVKMGLEKAEQVRRAKQDIILTCHAPYYINLNSNEPQKIRDSIMRILDTARVAHTCGAWSITFHAGFYMKSSKDEAYQAVRAGIREVVQVLNQEGISIWLRPETTGKASQFGLLDEILRLSSEFSMVMPCIDFAHLHARSGKSNTLEEFRDVLARVKMALGRKGLDNLHIHMSGIAYGEKGERNHLELLESDMNFKDLLLALKEVDAKGVVISESPNIEADALLMKCFYESL